MAERTRLSDAEIADAIRTAGDDGLRLAPVWSERLARELQEARAANERLLLERDTIVMLAMDIDAALQKLNRHHTHEHHHDDPEMPVDRDIAEGFFAKERIHSIVSRRALLPEEPA